MRGTRYGVGVNGPFNNIRYCYDVTAYTVLSYVPCGFALANERIPALFATRLIARGGFEIEIYAALNHGRGTRLVIINLLAYDAARRVFFTRAPR